MKESSDAPSRSPVRVTAGAMAGGPCPAPGPRWPPCPPPSTVALGLLFVLLAAARLLLLRLSSNAENKYDFHPASVNLLAELLKLLSCLVMSVWVIFRDGRSFRDMKCSSIASFFTFLKWAIPAFLYFLDNLIIFYVMTYLQPAMAVLFSNFVIITTAVLFRIVLKRRLSWVQWAALVILFLSIASLTTESGASQGAVAVPGLHSRPLSTPSNSCLLYTQLLEQVNNSDSQGVNTPVHGWRDTAVGKVWSLGAGHILLFVQTIISAMANIYTEKIFKEGNQMAENIFIQNSKLYIFGVVFNGLTLRLNSEAWGLTKHCGLLHGHNIYSLSLVLMTAALGLSVAFILKFKDNMFHVLTGQITTVLVSILSLFLFDFHPSLGFYLHAPIILLTIFIYNASKATDVHLNQEQPPVIVGTALERSRGDGEELEPLMKTNTDSEYDDDSL